MTVKHRNYLITAGYLLYLVLFLKLSTYDLSFSQYLTSVRYEPFVLWGKHIGVLPASVICSFSFCVMARRYEERSRYLCLFAGYVSSVIASYYVCSMFLEDPYILCAACGAGVMLVMRKAAEKIPLNENTLRICQAGALLAVLSVSLTTVLKVIWGRPRFCSLSEDMHEFAEWYHIAGPAWFEDMYKSFPSGHTTAASALLWIRYLPGLDHRLQGKERILTAIAILWIICTALSRIMAGMHYITDTMAAFALCFTVYLALDRYGSPNFMGE